MSVSRVLLYIIENDYFITAFYVIYAAVIIVICIVLGWLVCRLPKPENKSFAYAPMLITLSVTLIYLAFFESPQINSASYLLTAIVRTFFTLFGPVVFLLLFRNASNKANFVSSKHFVILPAIVIISSIVYLTASYSRYETVFTDGRYVNDGIYFGEYVPFIRNNKLVRPGYEPSIAIYDDYPRLDGATAFFPVYSAVAQAVYKDMSSGKSDDYIFFSKTSMAYKNLVTGKADIIFALEPSKHQMEMAEQAGVELIFTPIGKEAFIFFANKDYGVNSLTKEQIVDIYTGEINNWSHLGGMDAEIYPMRRPENSGSQTIMENIVMGGKEIKGAVLYETMYDILEAAIDTSGKLGGQGTLGYSFRFFANEMSGYNEVKIMDIENVPPSKENIANGSYPFAVEFYAITTNESMEKENVNKLISWLAGEEGQTLIEATGYNGM